MKNEGDGTRSAPVSPRRFGQLPGLSVPDDFDQAVPETEAAVWEPTDSEPKTAPGFADHRQDH